VLVRACVCARARRTFFCGAGGGGLLIKVNVCILSQFKTVAGRLNHQPCRQQVHKNFQLELLLERLLANITMVVQRANGEVTCFSFYLYALYEYRVLFLISNRNARQFFCSDDRSQAFCLRA